MAGRLVGELQRESAKRKLRGSHSLEKTCKRVLEKIRDYHKGVLVEGKQLILTINCELGYLPLGK